MFTLFFWGIMGPLGIRALYGTKEFHPDVICNRDTGIVSQSNIDFDTVISAFIKVLTGKL